MLKFMGEMFKMNKFLQFTWLEFKLMFRVPISVFFAILLPQLFLFAIVATMKNTVIYGNVHFVDVYLPSLIVISLFSAGIISFAVIISGNRSKKLWQTYVLKGFKLYHVIFSQLIVYILLAFISMILVIFTSKLFFGLILPSSNQFMTFCMSWLLSAISIFLIGSLIGSFSKDEKVAQPISTTIMFILMVTSGIFANIASFPSWVQNIIKYLPTTQAYLILYNYWIGENLPLSANLPILWCVLGIWIIFAMVVTIWKLNKDNFSRN
jgi:ABC-2 type transport system permease protein